MLPDSLLSSDDDWIERFRKFVYPRIHDELSAVGDSLGINLYATGIVTWNQYVGDLDEAEDTIESEIDAFARRNPIACLKELKDGRESEGSWVFLHQNNNDLIEPGMQLHITMFQREDGEAGREIYAHYEDDWRTAPLAHLRANNFNEDKGVKLAKQFFDENTFLKLE